MIQMNLFTKQKQTYRYQKHTYRDFLEAQCIGIHLLKQGMQLPSLIREDSTFLEATKPVQHNYWAPVLGPVLLKKSNHCNEKPTLCKELWPPLSETRESPHKTMKTQRCQKLSNKYPGLLHWVQMSFLQESLSWAAPLTSLIICFAVPNDRLVFPCDEFLFPL